jgi:hypothetical protein
MLLVKFADDSMILTGETNKKGRFFEEACILYKNRNTNLLEPGMSLPPRA